MYCIESLLLSLTKLIGRLAKHHIQFFFSHKKNPAIAGLYVSQRYHLLFLRCFFLFPKEKFSNNGCGGDNYNNQDDHLQMFF